MIRSFTIASLMGSTLNNMVRADQIFEATNSTLVERSRSHLQNEDKVKTSNGHAFGKIKSTKGEDKVEDKSRSLGMDENITIVSDDEVASKL